MPTGRRPGRPSKPDAEKLGVQIALRLDAELLRRLNAHRARLQAEQPGMNWSRSDAVRALLIRALSAVERHGPPPSGESPLGAEPLRPEG